jgi:23S rRNA (cytidine1920-2'-O)/16S rRNA (cytidine1409-2'-O)-methyltransferase
MVRRGLVGSRSEAAQAIASGKVAVAGRPADKAGTLVLPGEPIVLEPPARRFVSRGGEKLDAALDRFAISVRGRRCLDAGSSTGGFVDCLLSRGAAHVIAVDVGYGQLDWRLQQDPRVTVMDRTNMREVVPADLPYRPDLLTADLSFISLRLIVPALGRCAAASADLVALVKPQFEAGRAAVGRRGVVSDPAIWRRAIGEVAHVCAEEGFTPASVMASPLLGPAGNAEFLLHALRPGTRAGRGDGSGGRRAASGAAIDEAVDQARSLLARERRG